MKYNQIISRPDLCQIETSLSRKWNHRNYSINDIWRRKYLFFLSIICLYSWPSKILLDKFIEDFIMRSVKFLQHFIRFGFNFGLGSPFWFVETFVPGAGPLTVWQSQLLTSTIEALGGVEKEVVLCYLTRYPEEGLQLAEPGPGLLDELVSIHDLYLLQREIPHPPSTGSSRLRCGRAVDCYLTRW